MRKCFVVVHRNYAEGADAYAFWDENDAKKSVEDDAETIVEDLTAQGYEPVIVKNGWDTAEVYVPDSDIYYEWSIIVSAIR